MTPKEFGQLLDVALAAWPDVRHPETKSAYWRNLAGLPEANLRAALLAIGQSWKREQGMPTAGDIRAVAEKTAREVQMAPRAPLPPATRTLMSQGITRVLREKSWQPETDAERDGAALFREILAAHHGVRFVDRQAGRLVNSWPKLEGAGLRAFNDFGGRTALDLVSEDSVMLARETFAKAYAEAMP